MWMYLAAFIDCDGWITSTNGKSYLAGLTQHEKCIDGMRIICKFLEENGIRHTIIRRNTNMFNIHIKHQKSLLFFLKKIRKYLLFKGDRADEAMKHLEKRLKIRKLQKEALNIQTKKKYWTDEEVSKMFKLLDKGYSKSSIATLLNRSKNSVYLKFSREKNNKKEIII